MEPRPPELPQFHALPIISEETGKRLIENLGLDQSIRDRGILSRITGENMEYPMQRAQALTNQVFGDLITINGAFVQGIDEELSSINPNPKLPMNDNITMGMALVLRAFDVNQDFGLIEKFNGLQPENVIMARSLLRKSIPSENSNISILRRLLTLPKIPDQQVTLNNIIKQTGQNAGIWSQDLIQGATAMYVILGYLWPKLYPQNQTPTTPTSGIPTE